VIAKIRLRWFFGVDELTMRVTMDVTVVAGSHWNSFGSKMYRRWVLRINRAYADFFLIDLARKKAMAGKKGWMPKNLKKSRQLLIEL
jgi:hypothetical protein